MNKSIKKTVILAVLAAFIAMPAINSFSNNYVIASAASYGDKNHGIVKTRDKNGVNVRATPGGKKIGALKEGTEVISASREGDWHHIISPIDGYVSAKYIKIFNYDN